MSLATLAAGYVSRLAGALVLGHFGDRFGRKSVMLATMIAMGLSSGLIGALPTYAQIGAAAPVLLVILRLIQGFAVGGEYGGAVLMTTEHAAPSRRGLVSGSTVTGAPAGSLLAIGAMTLVALLPGSQLLAWGWRLPFLVSFVLLAIGMYFRARISESPVFLAVLDTKGRRHPPLVELFRRSPGRLLHTVLAQTGLYLGQGVFTVFIVAYAVSIGYSGSAVLLALVYGLVGSIILTPVFAALSDRVGRRPFLLCAGLLLVAAAYPMFLLINSHSVGLMTLATTVYIPLIMTPATAVAPIMLSELFPAEVRFTAVATSYQLAQTIGSGFGPLIAASLIAVAGGGTKSGLVAALLVCAGLISTVAIWFLPETSAAALALRPQQDAATKSVVAAEGSATFNGENHQSSLDSPATGALRLGPAAGTVGRGTATQIEALCPARQEISPARRSLPARDQSHPS